jgi:uncharacterized protein (TIGR02996 family)
MTSRRGQKDDSVGKVLEEALFNDPDDVAAHAAYADWLTEQGDPRGEFIQVQLALEDPARPPSERKQLQKREQALLEGHGRQWLGELAPYLFGQQGVSEEYEDVFGQKCYQFTFARGWLNHLSDGELTEEFVQILTRAPEGRLLRSLDLSPGFTYGFYSRHLLKLPCLPNVRAFSWSEAFRGFDSLAAVFRTMPRLESLYVRSDSKFDTADLFGLKNLSHLRSLKVEIRGPYALKTLAANRALAHLGELVLTPSGRDRYEIEPYLTAKGFRALLYSPNLPSLTRLHLSHADLGLGAGAEIVYSGILGRLRVLELTAATLTDEDAEALAACPDLRNLELLNLWHNRLSEHGIQALRKVLKKAFKAENQQWPEEGDEYLFDGFIEE